MFAILHPAQGYLMLDGYYYSPEVKDAKKFKRKFDAEKAMSLLPCKQAIVVVIGV